MLYFYRTEIALIAGLVFPIAVDEAVKGTSVAAGDNVNVSSGRDINITGSNVTSESGKAALNAKQNVNIQNETEYHERLYERHEYGRSGLTVSVGGTAVEKVTEAVGHVERAAHVEDERLAALHGYKAYDTVKDNIKEIEGAAKDPAKNISLNVSIGSTKSKSESESRTVIAQGSKVQAGGDVNITATERDINIKGSSVSGENVSLNAQENLNITASENTNATKQDSKSSSASVGVGIDLATGSVSSVTIGGSKVRGEVDANSTIYNESTVTADKNLDFTSGADTNIQGGKLSGERLSGSVGGDLNIESKQDSNNYTEKNIAGGFGLEINLDNTAKISGSGVTGGASSSNIDSNYSSVTEQSGIYAGEKGFDIRVEKNTDLKGGVIASEAEAEKNKISTGTLTWEDIHNKAEYEADSKGIAIDTRKSAEKTEAGVTPNIGMPAADEAESTTKAAIAEGTIEIRDKEQQKQDVSQLNRDTQNSLDKLGEIFDLDDVKEKQEFAGLFQETAHRAIGDLTGKISSEEKAALNAFIDGLIAQWTNGDFLAEASGTVLLESMQGALNEIDDPAVKQIAAGVLGAVAGEIVSGNTQAGASGAISKEKYNHLTHEQYEKMLDDLKNAEHLNETKLIFSDNEEVSKQQEKAWFEKHKKDTPTYIDENNNEFYIPVNVGVDASGNEVYLVPGAKGGKIIVDSKIIVPSYMQAQINRFDTTSLRDGEFYSVSTNLGLAGASIAITVAVNQYNDIFQTIEFGYGVNMQTFDLSKLSNLLAKSSASWNESIGKVTDRHNQVIINRQELIDTMTGVGIGFVGNILNSVRGGSLSSNGNIVQTIGSNLSSDGFALNGSITISSYVGDRKK